MAKNISDPSQVAESDQVAKSIRQKELNDLCFVLSEPAGRRFMYRLMAHCKTFNSVWHPSALIHHNSGKQDVGHFVLSEILEAREEAYIEMLKENRKDG